jgi:hypothetical protein
LGEDSASGCFASRKTDGLRLVWGNAPKWFAAIEMIRLAADQDWLHKATKEISKYWRQKRERRQTPEPLSRTIRQQAA